MKRGPKPKPPHLKAVEGHPGHHAKRETGRAVPASPDRPSWVRLLPGRANARLRADAAASWDAIVPELNSLGLLARLDEVTLIDYAICRARILECERLMCRDGQAVRGERGWQKHPALTAAHQYRTQLRYYIAELGLAPSSRGRLDIPPQEPGDDQESRVFGS